MKLPLEDSLTQKRIRENELMRILRAEAARAETELLNSVAAPVVSEGGSGTSNINNISRYLSNRNATN